jgi:hypothetical protein
MEKVGLLTGKSGANADVSRLSGGHLIQLRLHIIQGVEYLFGIPQRHPTIFVEPDVFPLSVKELYPQILLQSGNNLRESRLGNVQQIGGSGHVLGFRHLQKAI